MAGLLERGLIEEVGRGDTPGAPVLYATTVVFERVFSLERGRESLPPLAKPEALRDRLHAVASERV